MKNFNFSAFRLAGETFLEAIVEELVATGMTKTSLNPDHLCFRVKTSTEYEFYKEAFLVEGKLLTEALVNGRFISTFLLNTPFRTKDHRVPLLELPAPKPGVIHETGFEHAEFVVSESFDVFAANYPHLEFKKSGNKILNPELCLRLTTGQAKFHHSALDRVIEIEEAKITDVIFDFDGTLIQSREKILEINRLVFSEVLEREVSLEEAIDKFHPEFSSLFEAFSVTCLVKRSRAVSLWGEVADRFSYDLFDGVRELLCNLQKANFRLHLWTARDEKSTMRVLKNYNLEDFFVTMSFANENHSKPHANSLNFDWQSAPKNSVLMIGDSSTDMRGAKNVGAVCAAALWDPYALPSSLISSGAEIFFDDVLDFERWLLKFKEK